MEPVQIYVTISQEDFDFLNQIKDDPTGIIEHILDHVKEQTGQQHNTIGETNEYN